MKLRRTRRGYEEIPPTHCLGCGQRFQPGAVLVGIQHCTCAVRMHRAHFCPCGQVTLTPPAGRRCRPQSLDGR